MYIYLCEGRQTLKIAVILRYIETMGNITSYPVQCIGFIMFCPFFFFFNYIFIFFFQNLVYSSDDIIPLYYDSAVTDKNGQRHGITSLIIFGSMYRFQLHWRDKSFHFFHNFTVSVVQFDTKYIYSHTYLIVSENATESANLNKEYLKKNLKGHILLQLPINSVSEGSNYIDWTDISQSVPFDFYFSHMTESNSQSKPVDCDIYDDCDERYRNGEFKYFQYKNRKFSIMSYNIWNMNPKTKEEVNYVQRMELLKQVKVKLSQWRSSFNISKKEKLIKEK